MKSRNLSSNYWGVVEDNLYKALGGTQYWSSASNCEAQYWAAKATRATAISNQSYAGIEIFESSRKKKPWMNTCYHKRIQGYNVPFGCWWKHYTGRAYLSFAPYTRKSFPTLSTPVMKHVAVYKEDAARRAWWHMQPRFEGEVDMLNFLFELRDFKSLIKHCLTFKMSYRKLRNILRRPPKIGKQDPTKGAAGVFLTWQLALKPLLMDLTSIHAQLCTLVREVQEEFNSAGSEDQSSHYSELLGSEQTGMTPGTKVNYIYGSGSYRSTMFTATMHYKYAYEMRSTIDAFVKYWGLSPSAETFWNAIPWTFVFDYFVKIGDSIHAMEIDQNVDLRMTDYAESLLTTSTTGTHLLPGSSSIYRFLMVDDEILPQVSYPRLISGTKGTIYERRVTSPNFGPALPRLNLPSGKQSAVMASLVRCIL